MRCDNYFDSVYNLYVKNREVGNCFLFRDLINKIFASYTAINQELDLSMFDFSLLCNIETFLVCIDRAMYQAMIDKYEPQRKEFVNQFFDSINIDDVL